MFNGGLKFGFKIINNFPFDLSKNLFFFKIVNFCQIFPLHHQITLNLIYTLFILFLTSFQSAQSSERNNLRGIRLKNKEKEWTTRFASHASSNCQKWIMQIFESSALYFFVCFFLWLRGKGTDWTCIVKRVLENKGMSFKIKLINFNIF